jgi:hypothetical protein
MNREEFEHVIRAAADATGESELVAIGSQAILGQFPEAPAPLLRSQEVDLYPRMRPELADEIDGAIGDGSRFHETFGYFGHGVGPETPTAPSGWEDRLVPVEVPLRPGRPGHAIAWCMETHDLVLSKLVAGRDKDIEFAELAIRFRLAQAEELRRRTNWLPLEPPQRNRILELVDGLLARADVEPSKTRFSIGRPEDELELGTQQRRRQKMEMTMSERLARMQELCKQATAIAGSAKHR